MDKRVKDILFKTYWSSKGWIMDGYRSINNDDFEYAKSQGLMFDNLTISGQELLKRLTDIFNHTSLQKVANAFLQSLATKRLDHRSALASYSNAERIIKGEMKDGWSLRDNYENEDLSVMNFERNKWGGVRHSYAIYNYLDLLLFAKEEIEEPKAEDWEIFSQILKIIDKAQPGDYPSKLRDSLKDAFKSTKEERSNLMEVLACADILKPKSYDRPTTGRNDWTFVEFWRGEDKYNPVAVYHYFKRIF
jgi:hypothetical protein